MEFSLHTSFCCLIFSLITISLLGLLLYGVIRLGLRHCNCEICQTYITSKWSAQFENLCDWHTHLLRNSPTKTIDIHVLNNIVTANPENVEHILKTRFENYPKGKPFSSILGDFLGKGIFNVDGELWKFQRKIASAELGSVSIRSYAIDVVNCEIQNGLIPLLVSLASKEEILDLQEVFKRFASNGICKFLFGLDPNSLELSKFTTFFDLASKLSAERAMVTWPWVWKVKRRFNLGSEKELKQAITMINVLAKDLIRKKQKMGTSSHEDLLSRFMGTIKDETYLRDIVVSFLLAGRDTVASALISLFWLLAQNPEVESAILAEADLVVGAKEEIIINSYEQMRELHYLRATVYESLRLFPPIQFDSKFCLDDDVLPDGTPVKRGTRVSYHPYAMGRMEEIWGEDCLEFKPERWLKEEVFVEDGGDRKSAFEYPVFQGGLRVCLGKEMAVIELECVALSLLRKFSFKLAAAAGGDGTSPLRFSPGLTATLAGGLPVLIKERRNQ